MSVSIPKEIIKEIADFLEMGMICFFHKPTGELEYYPDELRHDGFDEELWQDAMDKVENNYHEYVRFEGMENRESFSIIEAFVAKIAEERIRRRFEDGISFKKPFQNFKQLLYNYPELKQEWFDFKNQRYIEQVYNQLEAYNSLNKPK